MTLKSVMFEQGAAWSGLGLTGLGEVSRGPALFDLGEETLRKFNNRKKILDKENKPSLFSL